MVLFLDYNIAVEVQKQDHLFATHLGWTRTQLDTFINSQTQRRYTHEDQYNALAALMVDQSVNHKRRKSVVLVLVTLTSTLTMPR